MFGPVDRWLVVRDQESLKWLYRTFIGEQIRDLKAVDSSKPKYFERAARTPGRAKRCLTENR